MWRRDSFRLWLLQIIVILGLLALFLWLGMRPQSPSYTILDISVPTSTVYQNNQTGTVTYILDVQNPNKDSSIYYTDFVLTVFYNDDTVGQKTFANFHQGKGKTTQYIDKVDASERIWKSLLNGIANKTAQLRVGLTNRIRYQTLGIKSKFHGMHMQGDAKIGPDGKISGKKKKIKMRRASKKWIIRK